MTEASLVKTVVLTAPVLSVLHVLKILITKGINLNLIKTYKVAVIVATLTHGNIFLTLITGILKVIVKTMMVSSSLKKK